MFAEIPSLLLALAASQASVAQEADPGLALVASHPAAQTSQPGSSRLQVRAARMVLADGTTVEDGVIVVEDGRIVRVGRGVELDPEIPIVEHDGWLTAGIVVCQTHSGAAGEAYDDARSVLPEARLAHAFDPTHSDFEEALRAGITSMVIAPTDGNVAGGITAVVKTTGEILKKEAHLALSFTGSSLSGGPAGFSFFFGAGEPQVTQVCCENLFTEDAHAHAEEEVDETGETGDEPAGDAVEPPAPLPPPVQMARPDGGLEETSVTSRGSRFPTSYSGALRELGRLFAQSTRGAVARASSGELPVLIEAMNRNEVARALAFAKERGLKGAVRGAPLAAELVPAFRESGLGAVLGPYRVGQKRRSLESLRKLSEAGVPVAFALDAPEHRPEELRLSAAMALSAGAAPVQVWRALTADAARIAGVDDRVGLLERGKDADFVLWSGDPLNLTSRVVAVFVGGELAYDGARDE